MHVVSWYDKIGSNVRYTEFWIEQMCSEYLVGPWRILFSVLVVLQACLYQIVIGSLDLILSSHLITLLIFLHIVLL